MVKDILFQIKNQIVEYDEDNDQLIPLLDQALQEGVSAHDILKEALTGAMMAIGDAWNRGEVFIPEVIEAADLFQKAADHIEPQLLAGEDQGKSGVVVLGTVEGDLHNLGKNLVAVMLRTAGFVVIDLGINVPVEKFIEEAQKHNAQIVGLSALLTTTMAEQGKLIEELKERGLREQYKVIVGGAPVNERWADSIGADGYASNAGEAVTLAKGLVNL